MSYIRFHFVGFRYKKYVNPGPVGAISSLFLLRSGAQPILYPRLPMLWNPLGHTAQQRVRAQSHHAR